MVPWLWVFKSDDENDRFVKVNQAFKNKVKFMNDKNKRWGIGSVQEVQIHGEKTKWSQNQKSKNKW